MPYRQKKKVIDPTPVLMKPTKFVREQINHVCKAVIGVSAGKIASGQIKVTWKPIDEAESYTVKRSTTLNGTYTNVATGLVNPTFTNTGLTASSTYFYKIYAVNPLGEGLASNAISATA